MLGGARPGDGARFVAFFTEFVGRFHADREERVFLHALVREAEAAAHADAPALLLRYPPRQDPALTRGEGCLACQSYGERCDGLEAEWWTDPEWEEVRLR